MVCSYTDYALYYQLIINPDPANYSAHAAFNNCCYYSQFFFFFFWTYTTVIIIIHNTSDFISSLPTSIFENSWCYHECQVNLWDQEKLARRSMHPTGLLMGWY